MRCPSSGLQLGRSQCFSSVSLHTLTALVVLVILLSDACIIELLLEIPLL